MSSFPNIDDITVIPLVVPARGGQSGIGGGTQRFGQRRLTSPVTQWGHARRSRSAATIRRRRNHSGELGGVIELVAGFSGNTYRAVYTVKLRGAVYVLHRLSEEIHARHRHAAAPNHAH